MPKHVDISIASPGLNLTTRFAPSPTGYLHLGHALSALYVWGLGRKLSATILLRIEDHDRSRSRAHFETAILDDLVWLGLIADNQDEVLMRPSRFRQSDRDEAYADAIARLGQNTAVYACDCSRKRIAASAASDASGAPPDELRYDGHCRHRGLPRGEASRPSTGIRAVLPDEELVSRDLFLGELRQNPARQCGDLLLRDRHGSYTYQLAVAVDDQAQGVNLVIRGEDLTASTARQVRLRRWLGQKDDALFAHHPLLVDADGRKLGKRFLSEAIAKRRQAGERPEALLGEAAFLAGLQERMEPLSAADLPELFSV